MASSLISLIKEAIVTRSPKDVTIHQRTLVSEIIQSDGKGQGINPKDLIPICKKSWRNLILTHWIINALTCIILFVIAIIYVVYGVVYRIFTGEWRGMKNSSVINTIVAATLIIMSIIALVFTLNFLIREVVLPTNNVRVNNYGVISMDQGCMETHNVFLLNAASYWTNTGIQINKGDKVYVCASGSMYSDVVDMKAAAKENKKLKYNRSCFYPDTIGYSKDVKGVNYCIYGRNKDLDWPKDGNKEHVPRFGSILYQICGNTEEPLAFNDPNRLKIKKCLWNKELIPEVHQINFAEKKYCFDAEKSGTLYLTFNDILLDRATVSRIVSSENDSSEMYKQLVKKLPENLKNPTKNDIISSLTDCVDLDPTIWFKDNLGEALVSVRIEKNIFSSNLPVYKKILVWGFRRLDYITSSQQTLLYVLNYIIVILFWFVLDALISSVLRKSATKKPK